MPSPSAARSRVGCLIRGTFLGARVSSFLEEIGFLGYVNRRVLRDRGPRLLGRLDVGDIYKQVAFWQSTGQVSRDADPKAFIDLSFVQGHFNVPK